ncbi:MAG: hydrogenase formation protein HypD [Planctomycetaceae bacterium]|nr:hydrogenase formation protein HypD [Planctomycetaceae bacterium]
MKYVDEFRDAAKCRPLIEKIQQTVTTPRTIMEVCGGQTHGLLAHGIDEALRDCVRLLHGPGCPVCVTPAQIIDHAIQIAAQPDVIITSFGDMLRVPGNGESLLECRAAGGDVRMVYSPLDAVRLAQQEPDRQVVFLAVGFETTLPATALAVRQASQLMLTNFSLLVSHVRVQPAMELIMQEPGCLVEGFLAAGHVCAVSGYQSYRPFVERYRVPVVVTGFEPADLLTGILECVELIERQTPDVVNRYERSVRESGNSAAMALVREVYEECDQEWRGIGTIAQGGYQLREAYRDLNASLRFPIQDLSQQFFDVAASPCRAGDVLTGRIRPSECEHFGTTCTPHNPLGAPMVSTEGACAAYYRYAPPVSKTESPLP